MPLPLFSVDSLSPFKLQSLFPFLHKVGIKSVGGILCRSKSVKLLKTGGSHIILLQQTSGAALKSTSFTHSRHFWDLIQAVPRETASSSFHDSVWFIFKLTSFPLSLSSFLQFLISCRFVRPCALLCGFSGDFKVVWRGDEVYCGLFNDLNGRSCWWFCLWLLSGSTTGRQLLILKHFYLRVRLWLYGLVWETWPLLWRRQST